MKLKLHPAKEMKKKKPSGRSWRVRAQGARGKKLQLETAKWKPQHHIVLITQPHTFNGGKSWEICLSLFWFWLTDKSKRKTAARPASWKLLWFAGCETALGDTNTSFNHILFDTVNQWINFYLYSHPKASHSVQNACLCLGGGGFTSSWLLLNINLKFLNKQEAYNNLTIFHGCNYVASLHQS